MGRVIVVAIVLGVITLLVMPTPWLVIEDIEARREILTIPLIWRERFEIWYTHSVDRKPVCEVFSLQRGKGIVLHETYFKMFGAGMGHWEGHGYVIGEGEWIKIKDIDKPLGSFLLRIGSRGVDHILSVKGNKINLTEQAEGRLVEVKLETHPWILSFIK
jgi:hypothetical protein